MVSAHKVVKQILLHTWYQHWYQTGMKGLLTKLLLWPEAIPTLYQYQLPH
jgi:hypothetical protein